jgi:DNA-binding transcriptional ArsR family regulator
MSWLAGDWLKRALLMDAQGLHREPVRGPGFNPKPPGVMQEDGTSLVLLRILQDHPAAWFTAGELQRRSKRSRQAVSWALLYLRAHGLVSTAEDTSRNPRYLRYRLKAGAHKEQR